MSVGLRLKQLNSSLLMLGWLCQRRINRKPCWNKVISIALPSVLLVHEVNTVCQNGIGNSARRLAVNIGESVATMGMMSVGRATAYQQDDGENGTELASAGSFFKVGQRESSDQNAG